MATDSWVTIGGFIASTGSAIAAFFAVKQSVRQRTISIKPQLIIKDIELHMVYTENSFFPCEPYNKEHYHSFKIPLLNIGLGTALNIQYSWKFNYKNFSPNVLLKLYSIIQFSTKEQKKRLREVFILLKVIKASITILIYLVMGKQDHFQSQK